MLGTTQNVQAKRAHRKGKPIEAPDTSPVLNIVYGMPGTHHLRFADSMSRFSTAKPYGAAFLQLWISVSDAPAGVMQHIRDCRLFTRTPVTVEFKPDDDGKVATYHARWISPRGEPGPWSMPESMRIAA